MENEALEAMMNVLVRAHGGPGVFSSAITDFIHGMTGRDS
jgi:hypothetical protein